MAAPFFDSGEHDALDEDGTLEPHDPMIGALVGGRYQIQGVLGAGGMGVVYAAEHIELHRAVALKMIRPEAARDRVGVERFLSEARTAGHLGHPNVVDFFDLGRLPDGRPFMVMPLLRGHDFEGLLERRGAQSPETVADLLAGAAAGIDAMHAQGLVHRDIKPANLFLAVHDDGGSTTLVMDFGLTALQNSAARLTADNVVLGTPSYLPPECVSGEKMRPAGDVYCLAVVAYELIAGVLPFDAENISYLLAQKLAMDAPLLSKVRGAPSPALDALFARALARDPELRPGSCRALIDELRDAARTDAARSDAAPTEPAPPQTGPRVVSDATPERSTTTNAAALPLRSPAPRLAIAALLGIVIAAGVTFMVTRTTRAGVDEASRNEWEAAPGARGETSPGAEAAPPAEVEREPELEPEPETAAPPTESEAAAIPERRVMGRTPSTPIEPAPRTEAASETNDEAEPETEGEAESESQADSQAESQAPPEAEPAPDPEPAALTPHAVDPASPSAPRSPGPDRARAAALTSEANGLALRGLLPQAAERLQQATLAAPRYAPAWRSLGITHERLRHTAEARRAFTRYLRLAPGAADAALIRARRDAL